MAAIVKGSTVRIKRKESYWYNETGIVASREKEPTKSRYPITVRFEKGNYYGLQGIDGGNNTNNFHEDELELVESQGLLYDQLKGHIDKHFDAIISGKRYSNAEIKVKEWPLSDVVDSVFYMGLDSNGQIPTVPSKYWSENSAYPENNADVLSQNPLPD